MAVESRGKAGRYALYENAENKSRIGGMWKTEARKAGREKRKRGRR